MKSSSIISSFDEFGSDFAPFEGLIEDIRNLTPAEAVMRTLEYYNNMMNECNEMYKSSERQIEELKLENKRLKRGIKVMSQISNDELSCMLKRRSERK